MSEDSAQGAKVPKKKGGARPMVRADDARQLAQQIVRQEKIDLIMASLGEIIYNPKEFHRLALEQKLTAKEFATIIRSDAFDDVLTTVIGLGVSGAIEISESRQRLINMYWKRFGKIQNINNFFSQKNTIEKVVMQEAPTQGFIEGQVHQ